MNTARIVVLTIAVGAIGAAACSARGADSSPSAEPAVRPLDARSPNSGQLSRQLNRFTASNIIQRSARDDRAFRRGDDIKVATQK